MLGCKTGRQKRPQVVQALEGEGAADGHCPSGMREARVDIGLTGTDAHGKAERRGHFPVS
jgi:hypothetical protein